MELAVLVGGVHFEGPGVAVSVGWLAGETAGEPVGVSVHVVVIALLHL
jgi:hypothetical protein